MAGRINYNCPDILPNLETSVIDEPMVDGGIEIVVIHGIVDVSVLVVIFPTCLDRQKIMKRISSWLLGDRAERRAGGRRVGVVRCVHRPLQQAHVAI